MENNMKMKEALDLFLEIDINCSLDKTKTGLHFGLEQLSPKDEFALLISYAIVSDSSLKCIKNIVKKCVLRMSETKTESGKYLKIYK